MCETGFFLHRIVVAEETWSSMLLRALSSSELMVSSNWRGVDRYLYMKKDGDHVGSGGLSVTGPSHCSRLSVASMSGALESLGLPFLQRLKTVITVQHSTTATRLLST